jgi:D-sedoheptulose 7-phosphate isomerase
MNNIDQLFLDSKNIKDFSVLYLGYLGKILSQIDTLEIERFVSVLLEARKNDKTIFFIGNGGSASTASHFSNDLSIGVKANGIPFRSISLCDNSSILTALSNDFGYDEVYVRQLKVQARSGDVLVGISASGNSSNIVNAFKYAKEHNIISFAITAFDGGAMKLIADDGIHIKTDLKEYGPAEDAHLILDHLTTSYLTRLLSNG